MADPQEQPGERPTPPAKKATAKKAPATKAVAKKAPAKKAPAKKSPATTAAAKKVPAKKVPAKKAPAKAVDVAPAEPAARTARAEAPALVVESVQASKPDVLGRGHPLALSLALAAAGLAAIALSRLRRV
jgi:hypothetical protein